MNMMCSCPLLRHRLTTDVKNILLHLAKNNNNNNAQHLAKIQNFYFRHGNTIYGLQSYSTDSEKKRIILTEDSPGEITTGTFETVKETTKNVWYGSLVVVGVGLGAVLFYGVFREFFSKKSVNNVYTEAYKKCLKNDQVIFNLGEPILGHGEENRRRRTHISHLLYEKDGVNYLRMKFYLKGSRRTATVHLEMKENERKDYEYRYLFVQLDTYPYTTIILEDNRAINTVKPIEPLNKTPDLL